MRKIKKHINNIIFVLMILLIFYFGEKVYAEEIQLEAKPLSEKYIEWTELSREERENTIEPQLYTKKIESAIYHQSPISRNLGASSKYNLRDTISLKIKNQMQTEQCWAFAATTQLESYMALVNNKTVEYSPRHMEYSTAKTFTNGVNPNGFNREVNSGGDFNVAYGYLTSGQGPILEEDMPFVNTAAKISLEEIQSKTVQGKLKEYINFPALYKEKVNSTITYYNGETGPYRITYTDAQVTNLRNNIKSHIIKYGAVVSMTAVNATQFYTNPSNYTSSKAYNCDNATIGADHAVTIIGWDDNYAVTNFNSLHRPTSPGAWIIQNSYGNSVFDNGLLYISYEDYMIEQKVFGVIDFSEIEYDNIYQYDNLGMSSTVGISKSSSIYTANVFTKKNSTEYIKEIGIYTNSSKNYTYNVFVNNEDGTLNMQKLQKVKTITGTDSDYITIELDNPIKINGEQFVVAVNYMNSENGVEAPVEARITNIEDSIWNAASSNSGESFVYDSEEKTWLDMKDVTVEGMDNINACIKVFTTDETVLSSNEYIVSKKGYTVERVPANTDVTTFKNNIESINEIKLFDKKGNELTKNMLVTTGTKIQVLGQNNYFTVIVQGDTNGDGKVTITDLLMVKKCAIGSEQLSGIYELAGDVNGDSKISITDIVNIKRKIVSEK